MIVFLFMLLVFSSVIAAPGGRIQVVDNRLKKAVPVQGVEIELIYKGGSKITYTDSLGQFSFSSTLPKGKYKLNWRYRKNTFYLTDGLNVGSIDGPSSNKLWNLTISEKGKKHYFATVFRAGVAYVHADFVDRHNLFNDVEIKAKYKKKIKGPGRARYNAFSENLSVWAFNHVNNKPYNDIRLFGYVVHEFGHAHHDHVFRGGSQHLKTTTRLKESWADAVKFFLVKDEYGEGDFEEIKTYSKQVPYFNRWRNYNWGKRKKYFSVYTPLVIDLVDTVNQKEIDDRVSGYTMKQILAVMKDKSCEDFDDLERLLKQRYNNPTEKYLGILFEEMEEH